MNRKNIIGLRVKKARKQAHVTQMELAARLQLMNIIIDRSTIAKIEGGIRSINDIEIAAMADILNIPITWLFEDSQEYIKNLKK